LRKPINKLRFLKFLKKAETDQKFEETDQQIEIFKVFEKSGNGSKIWGNRSKIWGNRSILKFYKKAETDQKYEETDQKFEETDQQIEIFKVFEKSGNGSKIWGNGPKNMRKLIKKKRKPFNSKYWETDTKYSEIPQQFWTFEGFPRISKKKRKCLKNNFWSVSVLSRFHVEAFPVAHIIGSSRLFKNLAFKNSQLTLPKSWVETRGD